MLNFKNKNMNTLTPPQGKILQFLIKMGCVTIYSLNRKVVLSLQKLDFVTIENEQVNVTQKGERYYYNEVESGKNLLRQNLIPELNKPTT